MYNLDLKSASTPRSIKLQTRDVDLLRGLFESRVMTTTQIASIHFAGRAEMTKKRLQRLTAVGLIRRRQRARFEPAIHMLAKGGIETLRRLGIFHEYPLLDAAHIERRASVSATTLQHELAVMDVKTAIHHAANSAGLALTEFTTWPLLNQFTVSDSKGLRVLVKPDGFFRLVKAQPSKDAREWSFFVELDRSTEVQARLIARARHYVEHFRASRLTAAGRDRRPFQVLYILENAERRNNTAERLLSITPPILNHVWLTTFEEVTRDPLGPIWIRPIDYRDRLDDTLFDTRRIRPQPGYKRRTPRDRFVEGNVPKCCLLPQSTSRAPIKSEPTDGPLEPQNVRHSFN